MEPVSITSFAKSPEVAEIIEKSGTVYITPGSEPGVTAGNKKISGLKEGKYYMVEECDTDGDFKGFQLVSASGERTEDVANIGRAKEGGEITGLTNGYQYQVRAAQPLPDNNVTYRVLTSPGNILPAHNDNGVITLQCPPPEVDNVFVYLLTPPPPPTSFSLDIAEIPVSPAGHTRLASKSEGEIITLISHGTKIDYVFVGKSGGKIRPEFFYFLTVDSEPEPPKPPEPGTITITVGLQYTDDNSPIPTGPYVVEYSQMATGVVATITVSNASQYDTIAWFFDGNPIVNATGSSLSLNIDADILYKLQGMHIITIEAKIGNAYYSTAIEVEVKP